MPDLSLEHIGAELIPAAITAALFGAYKFYLKAKHSQVKEELDAPMRESERLAKREARIDDAAEDTFKRYDRLMAELRTGLTSVQQELKFESEQRKLAEIGQETTNIVADELRLHVNELKAKIQTLQTEIGTLSRQSDENDSLARHRLETINAMQIEMSFMRTELDRVQLQTSAMPATPAP